MTLLVRGLRTCTSFTTNYIIYVSLRRYFSSVQGVLVG